jgi:hypothetical protein
MGLIMEHLYGGPAGQVPLDIERVVDSGMHRQEVLRSRL